jgi:hypothetical protein
MTKDEFEQDVHTKVADEVEIRIIDGNPKCGYKGPLGGHPYLMRHGGTINVTNAVREDWYANVKRIGNRLKVV